MYFIFDMQKRVGQIGLGKLSADLSRGVVGAQGECKSSDIKIWQRANRTFNPSVSDFRFYAPKNSLFGLVVDVSIRLSNSKMSEKWTRLLNVHHRKFTVLAALLLALPLFGMTFSKQAAVASVQPISKDIESREELIQIIESSKAAKTVARNKSHYAFGRFFYLGGTDGLAVLPMGKTEAREKLLLVTAYESLAFLGETASLDITRKAQAHCEGRFLYVLGSNERVAIAVDVSKDADKRFGLFALDSDFKSVPEGRACETFDLQLKHANEEWAGL